ncbi:hypothetical protein LJK88_38875 [Paenibacillus sp. P26]|nr:hypothetical protein LJK88_38875 [Paenibacillus sp. P26]UUZ93128.1 hypothetical protein LJK87_49435 [Paenibacillus sp. P25]
MNKNNGEITYRTSPERTSFLLTFRLRSGTQEGGPAD